MKKEIIFDLVSNELVHSTGTPGDSIVRAKLRIPIQLLAIVLFVWNGKLLISTICMFNPANYGVVPDDPSTLWLLPATSFWAAEITLALWMLQTFLGLFAFYTGPLLSVSLFAGAWWNATSPEPTYPKLSIRRGVWKVWILFVFVPAMLTICSFGILPAVAQVLMVSSYIAGVCGQKVTDLH